MTFTVAKGKTSSLKMPFYQKFLTTSLALTNVDQDEIQNQANITSVFAEIKSTLRDDVICISWTKCNSKFNQQNASV